MSTFANLATDKEVLILVELNLLYFLAVLIRECQENLILIPCLRIIQGIMAKVNSELVDKHLIETELKDVLIDLWRANPAMEVPLLHILSLYAVHC